MQYYFAPMEGVTGYIYRSAHHSFFHHVDKYFTPFLTPNQKHRFSTRELNDILPEHNRGMHTVPQILTNHAEAFIWTAKELKQLGYEEVNLNLGCPSGTVVSKHKGSGFLAQREELDHFLETVFGELDMKVSIKTRIGKDSPEEWYELMEIYNKYPMEELIIHPRIRTDFYKNKPNLEVFSDAMRLSKNRVCYNGDLFTLQNYKTFTAAFPDVNQVMLGRGFISNPALCEEFCGTGVLDKLRMKAFYETLYEGYRETIPGDRNVLFRMKELWFYMSCVFTEPDKYMKKIRKAERLVDYEAAVCSLFQEQEIARGAGYLA